LHIDQIPLAKTVMIFVELGIYLHEEHQDEST